MEGLNKEFTDNPDQFLRTYPVGLMPEFDAYAPEKGIIKLDIQPAPQADGRLWREDKLVALGEFDKRGKKTGLRSHKIKAYWLPWEERAVTQIELGKDAEYFFTSQLGGCQVRVVPNPEDSARPLVLHVAGNETSGEDRTGHEWRDTQVREVLSGDQYQRSRALSSTDEGDFGYKVAPTSVPRTLANLNKPRQPEGGVVNLVGVRKDSEWEFLAQQVDGTVITRFWRFF